MFEQTTPVYTIQYGNSAGIGYWIRVILATENVVICTSKNLNLAQLLRAISYYGGNESLAAGQF